VRGKRSSRKQRSRDTSPGGTYKKRNILTRKRRAPGLLKTAQRKHYPFLKQGGKLTGLKEAEKKKKAEGQKRAS